MEKSEGRKQGSSPGSSSRRAYSLFSSIINLSSASGVKTTDGSSSQQSPHTIPITSTNHQKLSSDAPKKKKGNQSSSPNQSIGSPRTGLNGPMGPAPKTLSILTALSELANSDQAGVIDSNDPQDQDETRSVGGNSSGRSKGDDNHQSNSNIYRRISSTTNHHSPGSQKHKRDDLPTQQSSLGFPSMPRKLKGSDRNAGITASPSGSTTSSGNRVKSKERTPDWIWRIFQLAKHGRLEELQKSLKGLDPLDPTLIRHLVDEKGNTLLHCAARRGHISTLQWLVSILGAQAEAVLNDRNRAGRNVLLTALKGGQLKCFQWLVLQSVFGDKALVPKEREQSLLHFAANYGNEPAVRWLAEQLKKRNVPIDLKDSSGLTPLHMAAKSGSLPVCHSLIVNAGADPFCQTDLGWRASDLALLHRHIESANYLMMAEAASSLGNELSSLLTLYKNMQKEHEALRHNFREVLRVGKSLVKERVDLIKSFPSAGSKSSPEAELLLGGTSNNGARFSGLEHKLVKAEQAWKRMEQSQVDKLSPAYVNMFVPSAFGITNNGFGTEAPPLDADFTVQNINSHNLLQKRLAGLQSRQDKNLTSEALLSASSSDAESTASASSSTSNDDQEQNRHHADYHRQTRKRGLSLQQSFNPSDSNRTNAAATTAPWLLFPDDTLLSALSPIVNQIDGTPMLIPSGSTKEFIPNLDLIQKGPSSSSLPCTSTGKVGQNTSAPMNQSSDITQPSDKTGEDKKLCKNIVKDPPSATILEVIEPPNKSVYFTPDLIRGTRHKPSHNIKSDDPVWTSSASPTRSSSSINDMEDIYDQITTISRDQSSTFKPSMLPKDASVTCSSTKTESWHHRPGGGGSAPPSSCITPSHTPSNSLQNSPRLPTLASNSFNQQQSELSSTQCRSDIPPNTTANRRGKDLVSSTDHFLRMKPSSKSSPENSGALVVRSPTVPALNQHHVDLSHKSVKTSKTERFSPDPKDENSSWCETEPPGPSTALPNDSALLSNTRIIKRSLSSVSRMSATVEIPVPHKNTWVSSEHLNFTTSESNLGGRVSPAPSESSRTESALVPPSHTSQISELSKTESGTEPSLSVYNLDETIFSDERLEEEQVDDACQNDLSTECKMIFSESSFPTFKNNKYRAEKSIPGGHNSDGTGNDSASAPTMKLEHPTEKKEVDIGDKRQERIEPEGRKKHFTSGVSTKLVSSLTRPGGSAGGIHKATIQRVTKQSSRGPPKPWYEIECSDEEGSHMLRIARTSRSCLSTSSFSTHSENESDTEDEHTCDANCTQNNCPDCV